MRKITLNLFKVPLYENYILLFKIIIVLNNMKHAK